MKDRIITVTLNPAIDKTVYLDGLRTGALNRVIGSNTDAGGKGINVAKVLHRLNVDVTASGIIAGTQGEIIINCLDGLGIDTDFYGIKGETRINLKIVDIRSGITTEINEPGFDVSKEDLEAYINKVNCLLTGARILILSGSVPPGIDPGIYEELIRMAGKKGVKCILDASGVPLRKGIRALPYAVKPNVSELEELFDTRFGSEEEISLSMKNLIDMGIEMVVVSMGEKGCIIKNRDVSLRAFPPVIEPKCTVGAGDSMVAALAYSMLGGFDLELGARWMTASGAITASKPGTQVGSYEEIRQSLDGVRTIIDF